MVADSPCAVKASEERLRKRDASRDEVAPVLHADWHGAGAFALAVRALEFVDDVADDGQVEVIRDTVSLDGCARGSSPAALPGFLIHLLDGQKPHVGRLGNTNAL